MLADLRELWQLRPWRKMMPRACSLAWSRVGHHSLRFLFTFGLVAFYLASAQAGIKRHDDTNGFSGAAVTIDFEGQIEGADAVNLFGSWHLAFKAPKPDVVRIRTEFVLFSNNVIRNEPTGGSSADRPMIINLGHPMKRVGFVLGNGGPGTRATARAYGELGNLLGEEIVDPLTQATFLGLEDEDDAGIAKITIDYGASENEEQIDDLIFDHTSAHEFNTYVAQVADGPLPGGALQTVLVVSNLSATTAAAELRLFDTTGAPLELDLSGTTASVFPFSIEPFGSSTFSTSGAGPLSVGYACVVANAPVDSTAIFRVLDAEGNATSEAGIGGATGRYIAVGVVQRRIVGDFNSGVAAVNISSEANNSSIHLLDSNGVEIASDLNALDLAAGQQRARFLNEIFPDLPAEDLDGTLVITSDKPIVVVILRTARGVVISSLPVGSTQR